MPSAIGGLTPEYRGADIRCGLNERLGCGTFPTLVLGYVADAAFSRTLHRFSSYQSAFVVKAVIETHRLMRSRICASVEVIVEQ